MYRIFDAAAARRVVKHYPARRRLKIFRGILGIDPALDGVKSCRCVGDMGREPLARRDQDLFLDQVAAVNLLGDRVLDLDAGVHLDEIIMALVIDQELHRAGILIAN